MEMIRQTEVEGDTLRLMEKKYRTQVKPDKKESRTVSL